MTGFVALLKRELFSMFVTPVAWVVIVAFSLIQGFHFFTLIENSAGGDQEGGPAQAFFGGTILLYLPLILFTIALTMRSFAEERRSGTIEALLTAPVGTPAVVLAKFFGAYLTYLAMWAPTLFYMMVVRKTGTLDWKQVAAGYTGIALVGAAWIAIGTLTSALTKNQIIALVLSALVTVGLFILGLGEMLLPDGPVRDLAGYVSVWGQMNDWARGVVDLRRIVFDLSLTFAALFTTTRVVDSWRWG